MITLGETGSGMTDAHGLWGTAGIPPSQERYLWQADSKSECMDTIFPGLKRGPVHESQGARAVSDSAPGPMTGSTSCQGHHWVPQLGAQSGRRPAPTSEEFSQEGVRGAEQSLPGVLPSTF